MKTYNLLLRICLRWIGPLVTIPVIFLSDAPDLQKGVLVLVAFMTDCLAEIRGRDLQLRQLIDLRVIRSDLLESDESDDSDDSDHLITGSGNPT